MYGLESLWFNIKDGYVGEHDHPLLWPGLVRATTSGRPYVYSLLLWLSEHIIQKNASVQDPLNSCAP